MSDIANCCEYLTSEKLCLAVSDSERAKASRQVRCKNEEKMSCCYHCLFVLGCATPCRFLGNAENSSSPIEVEKIDVESKGKDDNKIKEYQPEKATGPCCSLCDVEMSQTQTEFRIDGRERLPQSADNSLGKLGKDVLPIIVYFCPKCGKIDLKVDEKPSKH